MDENRRINLFDLYRTYLKNNRDNRRDIDDETENWTGRWMPDRLGDPTPPPKVYPHSEQGYHESMSDSHMGRISDCDDAQVNILIFHINSLMVACELSSKLSELSLSDNVDCVLTVT